MAAEGDGLPNGGPAAQEGTNSKPAPADATPAAAIPEKLTAAQLKAKAKAEKAARRAQVKETRAAAAAAPPPQVQQPSGTSGDAKGGKGKGKQDAQQGQSRGGQAPPQGSPVTGRRASTPIIEKDVRSGIPESFSHVPMAKRLQTSQAHKDVHPAVLAVGQQMATFALKDSISRLDATLRAFRKVRVDHLIDSTVPAPC